MKIIILIILSLFLFTFKVAGQDTQQKNNVNYYSNQPSFINGLKELNWSDEKKAEFSLTEKIPLVIELDNGSFGEFQYQDFYKSMVYYKAYNSNVAAKINLTPFKDGSFRNLMLNGQGIIGGVWDERRAKLDHPEFTDRLFQVDGSSQISVHATHVSGTIFARGLNPLAEGFANFSNGLIFDWNSDTFEMLDNAFDPISKPNGMLVSNHSYGQVLGWQRNSSGVWNWFGNENISEVEDYRFGFYSQKSEALDNIAYERPYYSIVWAAGNDRNDIGDGSKPSDGPEDTIGPEGVAKNVFTVGAVNDFDIYNGPSSLRMSDFSSWGPTDDGRIKPDIVSIGVGVFSTSFSGSGEQMTDSYSNLSGTSMATPTVTGSLMLLQELSNKVANRNLWSSTLKALLLHTAHEAGSAPGPDYRYGWGLLNFEGAADFILNNDGESKLLYEGTLNNGETYSFDIYPDEEQLLKVTVVWTDPAGTPLQTSNLSELLNNPTPKLVNDLDIRIFDEDGQEYFPWTLDPSDGSNAIAVNNKDNFRDNVEQILVEGTKGGKYSVVINHKNTLVNDRQNFSLIVTTNSSKKVDNVFYWIGQSGKWNNGANWSFSHNGFPANQIPNQKSRVIIDIDEEGEENLQIDLDERIDLFAIEILGDKTIELIGNNNVEIYSKKVNLNNENLSIKNISLVLDGFENDFLQLNINKNINFDGNLIIKNSDLKIKDLPILGGFQVQDSKIEFDELLSSVSADTISFNGNSSIKLNPGFEFISNTQFVVNPNVDIDNIYSIEIGSSNGESILEVLNQNFLDQIKKSGDNSLVMNILPNMGRILLQGGKIVQKGNSINTEEFVIQGDTRYKLMENLDLTIVDNLEYLGSELESFFLEGISNNNIIYNLYEKRCFFNWNVSNVDLIGSAVLNLEGNSVILNSLNWLNSDCDKVLFADFTFDFACLNSSTIFQNISQGAYTNTKWSFPSGSVLEGDSVIFSFSEIGEFDVSLEVSNENESREINKRFLVKENPIAKPTIVINGNRLSSFVEGSNYQWFLNNEPIVGAINRTLEADFDGLYQVLVYRNDCNFLSDPIVVTSLEDDKSGFFNDQFLIYPNPNSGIFNIIIKSEYLGSVFIEVIDSFGRVVKGYSLNKSKSELSFRTNEFQSKGLYLVRINLGEVVITRKVFVN